jgi:hypothetical protein
MTALLWWVKFDCGRGSGGEQVRLALNDPADPALRKAHEEVDCLIGFRRRRQDGVLVALENLDPVIEIGGMVVEIGLGQSQSGTENRRSNVRDKFLHGVSGIAEAFAEFPAKPVFRAAPMQFMPISA